MSRGTPARPGLLASKDSHPSLQALHQGAWTFDARIRMHKGWVFPGHLVRLSAGLVDGAGLSMCQL